MLNDTDVARDHCQLPLIPADWPLICFCFEGRFFVDVNLPLGFRWAASHSQDATNIICRELRRQGLSLLNDIADFGGVAPSKSTAKSHFPQLQDLLAMLGLQEANHKSSPFPGHGVAGF